MHKNDISLALWVALFLFGIYMLTFDGTLHSTDGLSMLAVAENLVKHGSFDTRQLEDWENVALGRDGKPYTKYALGPSLMLAPFVALALWRPDLGVMQTALVLMPLATALTAAYLYLSSRRLGYPPKIGLAVAVLGGLATMAWIRTRDLVADPLILLGFTAAFYHALAYRQERHLGQAVLAGLALSLLIQYKLVNLVTVPLFLAYLTVSRCEGRKIKVDWCALALAGTISAIGLLIAAGYNFYRFGSLAETGYEAGFTTPLWVGLVGQLISPYKSLFLYVPLFVLLPFTLAQAWRKHPSETILILAVLASQILVYAGWHDWGGGKSWGPRFLAPLNSLLILLLLPLLEQVWQPGRRWLRASFIGLVILSLLVQVLGIAARDDVYLGVSDYWTPPPQTSLWGGLSWDKPQQWPIWGHLLAFDPAAIPVIWRWQWHKVNHFDGFSLLLAGLIVVMGLAGLWLVYRGKIEGCWWAVGGWLAALGCVALILARSYGDPRPIERAQEADEVWPGYEQLMAQLPQLVQENEAVIFTDRRFELYLLDSDKSAARRYMLTKPDQPHLLETVPKLLQQDRPRRVWLVTDELDNRLLGYAVELWLREGARPVEHYLFGESVQLVGFEVNSSTRWESIPPEPHLAGLVEPEDYTFKGFASLLGWRWPGLDRQQPPALHPGHSYPFELYWIYRGKAPEDAFFVQVVDQAGRVVVQNSTTPRPDNRFIPGQLVVEEATLAVPDGLASGRYRLQLGFKTPAVAAGELVFELQAELTTVEINY